MSTSTCVNYPSTFLCPSSCGFAKVAALELGRRVNAEVLRDGKEGQAKFRARKLQEHYKQYVELFKGQEGNNYFSIDINKFRKKLPQLRDYFKSWNPRLKDEKEKIRKHFSVESWEQLPPARRKEHRFANCPGCKKRDLEFVALFPVRSKQFEGKAKENAFFNIRNTQIKPAPKIPRPLSQGQIKTIAKGLYDNVNAAFEKVCNVPFATAISKIPELELQKKKSPDEVRRARRERYRKAKQKIEDAWRIDSLERYGNTCYYVRVGGGCHRLFSQPPNLTPTPPPLRKKEKEKQKTGQIYIFSFADTFL